MGHKQCHRSISADVCSHICQHSLCDEYIYKDIWIYNDIQCIQYEYLYTNIWIYNGIHTYIKIYYNDVCTPICLCSFLSTVIFLCQFYPANLPRCRQQFSKGVYQHKRAVLFFYVPEQIQKSYCMLDTHIFKRRLRKKTSKISESS